MNKYTDDMVLKAKELAFKQHENEQYAEGLPFTNHLDNIANEINLRFSKFVVKDNTSSVKNELLILAYLYRIFETEVTETEVTESKIKDQFGSHILKSLQLLQVPKTTRNRTKLLREINKKLATCTTEYYPVLIIKIIDRYCTLRYFYEKQDIEAMRNLAVGWKQFHIATFRPYLCEDVWYDMKQLYNKYRAIKYQ